MGVNLSDDKKPDAKGPVKNETKPTVTKVEKKPEEKPSPQNETLVKEKELAQK